MDNIKEDLIKHFQRGQKKKKPQITDAVRDRLAREFKGEVVYQAPMDSRTSMRLGGYADVLLNPVDIEDLKNALVIAREEELPHMYLGAGSNLLVKDGGIRGFVIHLASALSSCAVIEEQEDSMDILVDACFGVTAFVNFCRERNLTGMEQLIGIPGTMGGAVVMNAGARGVEIKDIVRSITIMDQNGDVKTLPRERLDFQYRQLKLPKSNAVLQALIRLEKGDAEKIETTVREYQKKRVSSQPLNYPNAGSIFKNPPSPQKGTPIYAAQLIEEAGLKNVRVGGARVSEKHANFIINERDAKAKDVVVLINLIRDKVRETTGVVLETEIKIVGEDA